MDWKSQLDALKDSLPQGNDLTAETPAESPAAAIRQPRLDVLLDKKGRKGKAATIVAGFILSDAEVEEIARKLKTRLGCGGSSRGGEILIQGDKRREVADALVALGLAARII